jgi:hypothetical protein
VAEQNVHGRPDGCMREQDSHTADMGGAPDLLHQKMAESQTILRNNGKTVAI